MSPPPTFEGFLERLRRGEPAVVEHFQRFTRQLVQQARGHLDARVRAKVDAEDVVQSALRSFLIRQDDEPFDLGGWDDLWALLTVIVLRKCFAQARHYLTAQRDVRREVFAAEESALSGWEGMSREPIPEETAMLAETLEWAMHGLDEEDRQVVRMSLLGYRVVEISEQLNRAERTIYRVLDRARNNLRRRVGKDSAMD